MKMANKICRICSHNQGETSIFNSDGESKICSKIMYFCVNVVIVEGDGLPTHICSRCEEDLALCHQFVLRCEAADRKFRSELANNSSAAYPEYKPKDLLIKEEIACISETDNFFDDPHNDFVNEKYAIPLESPELTRIKYESDLSPTISKQRYKKRKKSKRGVPCTCPICGNMSKCHSSLIIHMRKHTGEKPYACPSCDKSYKDSGSLKRHIDRNHQQELREKSFICENCGKGFYSKNDIKIHLRTHTGETPFACPICPAKFTQQSTLIRHERRHTGEKPFLCSTCSKCFSSKDELKSHSLVHTSEKPFTCPVCNGLFKYKNNLQKHIKLHSEQKSFVCNYCGRTFSAKGNLKIHIDSQHSEKSGHCNICLKNVSNLEVHMRKHTGERPLKCQLCPSTFFEPNGLAHHINFRHKNTGKYKCSYDGCMETFPSQPMRDFHEAKLHGTVIPYPCDRCSRGFYRKNDLARHKIGTHKERLKS